VLVVLVIFDGVRGLCLVVGRGAGWMRRVDVSVCGGLMRREGRGGALFCGWVIWLLDGEEKGRVMVVWVTNNGGHKHPHSSHP